MLGKKDYTYADDRKSASKNLKAMIDAEAVAAGLKAMGAKTNDELIDYASAVYGSEAASKAEEFIRGKLTEEAKKTAKAAGKAWSKADDAWVKRIINQSFDSTTWSDRIWSDMSGLRADLYKAMRKNLLTHTRPTEFGKDLQKAFHVSHSQAERILRTEGARVSGMRQQKDLQDDGYEYAVWVATPTACKICQDLDGHVFKVSDLNEGKYTLPAHPNCRCTISAASDETIENDRQRKSN